MVPVIDNNSKPLMPCSEKRARKLMEKGQAKAMWKNQIFCIQLLKEPISRDYQGVVIGIDTGSKKEGITVATDSKVVLNILAEAIVNVSDNMKARKNLRKKRRSKAPYRKCRFNRTMSGAVPSIKAKWDQKLRIIELLRKMIPITSINIEDICGITRKGCRRWNQIFTQLSLGKTYFNKKIETLNLNLTLTGGFDTKKQRDFRGFKKTKEKLKNVWEAHCVDSHCLVEIFTNKKIEPFKGMYIFENFKFSRRQLHVQKPIKGGIRKKYGSTISLGIPRGALVLHPQWGMTYIGGTSKGRISLHCCEGKRLTRLAKKEDIKILNLNKWRTRFISDKRKVNKQKIAI